MLVLARSLNPVSVIFNVRDLCNAATLKDILVEQLGPVISLATRRTRDKHLLAEVLFDSPEQKTKALTEGIVVKAERILALPASTPTVTWSRLIFTACPSVALLHLPNPFGSPCLNMEKLSRFVLISPARTMSFVVKPRLLWIFLFSSNRLLFVITWISPTLSTRLARCESKVCLLFVPIAVPRAIIVVFAPVSWNATAVPHLDAGTVVVSPTHLQTTFAAPLHLDESAQAPPKPSSFLSEEVPSQPATAPVLSAHTSSSPDDDTHMADHAQGVSLADGIHAPVGLRESSLVVSSSSSSLSSPRTSPSPSVLDDDWARDMAEYERYRDRQFSSISPSTVSDDDLAGDTPRLQRTSSSPPLFDSPVLSAAPSRPGVRTSSGGLSRPPSRLDL